MTNVSIWLGFLISLTLLMVIARKNLWLALVVAAIVLGLFNLTYVELYHVIFDTLLDKSILLLSLAVGMIPIIGGALETSGMMDDIVKNLRIRKRSFLVFSPSLLGLLPMPGGALLSAPLIKKSGVGVTNDKKSAINVWYRHVIVFIYPLGALLPATKMAGLNLYVAVLYVIPGFLLMLVLGHIFLLRDIRGRMRYDEPPQPKKLAIAIGVILVTPLLHFSLMNASTNILPELYLVIAVAIGLMLAFYLGRLKWKDVKSVSIKMKPWNYALIIIGMFLFLNIFKASDTPLVIALLTISRTGFIVAVGAFLGFVTGRVNVPVSIMLPIYFSKYSISTMDPTIFAIMFFSIFMGYMISPVHPCTSVSLEYFRVRYKDFFRIILMPTIIALLFAFVAAMILHK